VNNVSDYVPEVHKVTTTESKYYGKWRILHTVTLKTEAEILLDNWQHPEFSKRITAPAVLVFEDIGINNDGTASTSNTGALIMQGPRNALVQGNVFTTREFSQVANYRAVRFTNVTILGTAYTFGNNLFSGNIYKGLYRAVNESAGGDKNFYVGEFADVTDAIFEAAAANTSIWSYQTPTDTAAMSSANVLFNLNSTTYNQKYGIGVSGSSSLIVVDATNSNAIPINIEAQAPTNSVRVAGTTGHTILGGSTPDSRLHVVGDITVSSATTAASATAGAETLPANPVGFLQIKINGTSQKIPYYAT
jgi:hypothetical protein